VPDRHITANRMRIIIIIATCYTLSGCAERQNIQRELKVDLSGQRLKQVPDSVYQNSAITYLDLGSNGVTIYPPLSAIIDTSKSNSISYLSEQIGQLTNLKTLILNANKLTTLPYSITKLKNLEVLDLSLNNDLDIVQQLDKLKQLPKLRILNIASVKLSEEDEGKVRSAFRPEAKIVLTFPELIEFDE
jgi:Leucine-rich repeat (LRR) protein